jgi:DNA polymerase elongation subunit (family B)
MALVDKPLNELGPDETRNRVLVYKAEPAARHLCWLHARDLNTNEKMKILLRGHLPYFFAEETFNNTDHPEIVKVERGYENVDGDPVVKVLTKTPGVVRKLRKMAKWAGEADIPYERRSIIDARSWGICRMNLAHRPPKLHQNPNVNEYTTRGDWVNQVSRRVDEDLEILYADIEGGNILNIEQAKDEVYCIALQDATLDNYHLWSYHPSENNHIDTCDTNLSGTVNVNHRHFIDTTSENGERQMLRSFANWIRDRDAEGLAGWNSGGRNGYDWPYLVCRMRRLGLDDNNWGRYGRVDHDWTNIPGYQDFDLLPIHRTATYDGFQDNTLANIAQAFCDITLHKDHDLRQLWLDDQEALWRYNIRDVEATAAIDKQQLYSDLAKRAMFLTYSTDALSVTRSTSLYDGLFLKYAQEGKVASPPE